jgi:hypothetical protein
MLIKAIHRIATLGRIKTGTTQGMPLGMPPNQHNR